MTLNVCCAEEHHPRYISLAPSTTEILFALGLADEVVGVSTYCNYPPQVKQKPKVGDFSSPNMEKIIALKPDYIFCTGLEQTPVIGSLRRQHLEVYISDPSNVRELLDSILYIGKLTKREKEAEGLIKAMEDSLAALRSESDAVPVEQRPRVFIEIWHDPLTTVGRGSFVDELIAIAGGVNVASDTRRPYSIFSPEEVIVRDPEVIIMAYMEKASSLSVIKRRMGWGGISAVRYARVYNDIDPDILLRPGPRIVQGAQELHRRFYR